MSIRTRCSSPLVGLRMGRPLDSRIGDDHPGPALVEVDLELDRLQDRLVHGARHGVVHPPMRSGVLRLSAVEDGGKSLALRGLGALVDDRLYLAVALEDRTWPGIEQGGAEAVERHLAKMAAVNPNHLEPAAVAVRRSRFELTGAAVIAVAVTELNTLDVPVDHACSSATARVLKFRTRFVMLGLDPSIQWTRGSSPRVTDRKWPTHY
jgi:hypothetical protein